MEKKIILTMHKSKNIDIVLDNDHRISIEKDNRSVKADDIYNLLGSVRFLNLCSILLY